MRHQFGNQLSISRPLANHVDISHRDANKRCAVAFIAGLLGIQPEQVATAGDGENDIPMFRTGGLSIAMGQASAVVHRAATHTTTSDADDGLAWAIEKLILKRRAA
jgi:hydroxymethylpyrimidine pyrophosphatase-like HAD family hydrolase